MVFLSKEVSTTSFFINSIESITILKDASSSAFTAARHSVAPLSSQQKYRPYKQQALITLTENH
jgi:hypothetical protein